MQVTDAVEMRLFRAGDDAAFRELNEAWIAECFGMGEHDHEMLSDPFGYVMERGGEIWLAEVAGRVVGCWALLAMEQGRYDVAKMAVAEECRGLGVGRKVLAYTIARARELGATSLYLETNKKLANAVHLYESLGFRHLPPNVSLYVRANVFMEMVL